MCVPKLTGNAGLNFDIPHVMTKIKLSVLSIPDLEKVIISLSGDLLF